MEDFLEINTMFLLRELAKKCIKLTEDANKLTLFTECPNDNVKKHGDVYYWPYEGNLIPFGDLRFGNDRRKCYCGL